VVKTSGNKERLNYYYSTIISGTTMQNAPALDLIDHIDDELANNP
jgi:hypothetical protein